jgi:2,3-diaminopropionate biosynthesis protein SbnA
VIFHHAYEIIDDNVFLELDEFIPGSEVLVKVEGLNTSGSIKLKVAVGLIDRAEQDGLIGPGSRLIESSSGNLGIALASVCAARRYPITIVTDLKASYNVVLTMRAMGAEVVTITEPDSHGGYLGSRINYVKNRIQREPGLIWLNQYANHANPLTHRDGTARSIYEELDDIDALFISVGTCGTLLGCVEYFSSRSPQTRVLAVDVHGSVLFGGPGLPRKLVGIGASRAPEILADYGRYDDYFEKIVIAEADAISMCREVGLRYGILFGGSTGAVLAAVHAARDSFGSGSRIVVISPDLGDRHSQLLYGDHP